MKMNEIEVNPEEMMMNGRRDPVENEKMLDLEKMKEIAGGRSDFYIYNVQEGDTITSIANMFGVDSVRLMQLNSLHDMNAKLEPGTQLLIMKYRP